MKKPNLWIFFLAGLGLLLSQFNAEAVKQEGAAEEIEDPQFTADEVLIKLKPSAKPFLKKNNTNPLDTGIRGLDRIHSDIHAEKFEPVARPGKKQNPNDDLFLWHKVAFKAESDKKIISKKDKEEAKKLQNILERYKNDPDVEAVEPNAIVHAMDMIPNDPDYPLLWGMSKIRAPQAWELNTGSSQVVVAVIDSGIDYTHHDLFPNMWINPGEIPYNHWDDDNNGYVDDLFGYDFINNDPDPMDDHFHGSHCAGTIGAAGNNGRGVAGVSWNVRLMALKFLGSSGSGSTSAAISAIQYAVNNGAHILSNSWGGTGYSQALQDAINAANNAGVLFIASAGNASTSAPSYPAAMAGVVSVAATNPNDQLADFSNYGPSIDLAAPGVDIYSCGLGETYTFASGTSMACPHVAGLAALIKAHNFNLTKDQITSVLQNSADDLGTPGRDDIYGYGRINALRALSMVNPNPAPAVQITSPTTVQPFSYPLDVLGTAAGSTFTRYRLEARPTHVTSWIPISSGTTPVTNGFLGRLNPTGWADGPVTVRLTVTDNQGADFSTQTVPRLEKARIASPNPFDESAGVGTPIRGTAAGPDFLSYSLEYAAGLQTPVENDPLHWIQLRESTIPVVDSSLGTLLLLHGVGYYTVRLTVRFASGTVQNTVSFSGEGDVLPGWPVTLQPPPGSSSTYVDTGYAVSAALIDGQMRLFTPLVGPVAFLNTSYVWLQQHQPDGTTIAGWPPTGSRSYFASSAVAVGDLDQDHHPEIGLTTFSLSPSQLWLTVLRSDGTTLWMKPLSRAGINFSAVGLYPTPTLEDINGDGFLDIVVGGDESGSVQAFDRFGNTLPGFPIVIPDIDTTLQPPANWPQGIAVADLDGDSRKELAFVARTRDGVRHLYLYRSNGAPYPMTQPILGVSGAPPVIGDMDGDGRLDLAAPLTSGIGAWRSDGTPLPGWPKTTIPSVYNCVLGDLNNDSLPEAIVTTATRLYAFKGDGSSLSGWPIVYPAGRNPQGTDPLIADINGDGKADVLVKQIQVYHDGIKILRVYAYDAGGRPIPGFPKQLSKPARGFNSDGQGSPALEDFNQDGTLDLVATSAFGYRGLDGRSSSSRIKIWSLPVSPETAKIQWGKDRGNLRNTGLYVPLPPSPLRVSMTSPLEGSVVSGTVRVTADAVSSVNVTRVEFYVDDLRASTAPFSPYYFNWATEPLTNGSHVLSARGYDAAGNVVNSAPVTVNVNNNIPDTVLPTVSIINPTPGSVIWNSLISMAATASDDVAVTRVEFYADNVLVASSSSPYAANWNAETATNGSHSLTAKAFDAAGNVGTSAPVTVHLYISDITPPRASITSPTAGSALTGTVQVAADAWDDRAVARVELYIDNSIPAATDSSFPYLLPWNTETVPNGPHSLTARAFDDAGNAVNSAPVTVTVNNIDVIAPIISITTPSTGSALTGTAQVTATASDNVGVTQAEFYVDNVLVATDSASPYSATWNTETATNESHTLSAKTYDAAGNVGTSASVTVNVNNADQTPPTVSITSPANGSAVARNSTISITVSASDNRGVTKIEFTINSKWVATDTSAPYSYTWKAPNTRGKSYKIQAKVYDAAGNVGSSSIVTVTSQ